MVAHNHFAVELLLLFLEGVLHLFPLQASVPRKRERERADGQEKKITPLLAKSTSVQEGTYSPGKQEGKNCTCRCVQIYHVAVLRREPQAHGLTPPQPAPSRLLGQPHSHNPSTVEKAQQRLAAETLQATGS